MFDFDHGRTLVNMGVRLCQMIGAIAVLAYYATPLKNAAAEHKYTDSKFVYATVVGAASLTTALSLFIIPIFNQTRGVSVVFFWEIALVILWIALTCVFRAFFTENPEMDVGIEKMKVAIWFDVACALLWAITAGRSTYVFFTTVMSPGSFPMGRTKKAY